MVFQKAVEAVRDLLIAGVRRMYAVALELDDRGIAAVDRFLANRIIVPAIQTDEHRNKEHIFQRFFPEFRDHPLHQMKLVAPVLPAGLAATVVGSESVLTGRGRHGKGDADFGPGRGAAELREQQSGIFQRGINGRADGFLGSVENIVGAGRRIRCR